MSTRRQSTGRRPGTKRSEAVQLGGAEGASSTARVRIICQPDGNWQLEGPKGLGALRGALHPRPSKLFAGASAWAKSEDKALRATLVPPAALDEVMEVLEKQLGPFLAALRQVGKATDTLDAKLPKLVPEVEQYGMSGGYFFARRWGWERQYVLRLCQGEGTRRLDLAPRVERDTFEVGIDGGAQVAVQCEYEGQEHWRIAAPSDLRGKSANPRGIVSIVGRWARRTGHLAQIHWQWPAAIERKLAVVDAAVQARGDGESSAAELRPALEQAVIAAVATAERCALGIPYLSERTGVPAARFKAIYEASGPAQTALWHVDDGQAG